jgi:hypothetical protein
MRQGTGEYRGGKAGGYARVHVCCRTDHPPFQVSIALDDHEWNDQLRSGAFIDWTDAAVAGCRYALDVASVTCGRWEIHRIVGLVVDTTPTFIAIAAARAAWNACDYRASETVDERLNEYARTRLSQPKPNSSSKADADSNDW